MVQSTELLLDDDTDRAVREQWALLADAGLPSQQNVASPTNRPHITLTVHDRIAPEAEAALTTRSGFDEFEIRLGAIVVFGGRRATLARLVVPSRELLALHRHVDEIVDAPDRGDDGRAHTDPDRWTPHVTLARRVPLEQLGTALTLLANSEELVGTATTLRRWDGDARVEWTVAGALDETS